MLGCLGFLIFFFLIVVVLAKGCQDEDLVSEDGASESTYQYLFQKNIKTSLRDPDSASFRWRECETTEGGKSFNGICEIRATNAFGAYVVDTFVVTGRVENGRIRIEWQER